MIQCFPNYGRNVKSTTEIIVMKMNFNITITTLGQNQAN